MAYLPFILAQFCKSPWEQFFGGGRRFCCFWGICWHVRFTLILIILSCGMVTGICYLRYTIIHDSPMNNVDTVSCVKYLMIWLRTIQFEMHRPVFFNRFDSKTLWLNSGANNVAKTILCHGSFVIIKSTNWRPPRVVFSWLIWLWRSLKITWPVINSSGLIGGKFNCKKSFTRFDLQSEFCNFNQWEKWKFNRSCDF